MLTREKRMIVFYYAVEGRSPRLYRCGDVCKEVTHDANWETTHHTIWPPAILLGLLHQDALPGSFYPPSSGGSSLPRSGLGP